MTVSASNLIVLRDRLARVVKEANLVLESLDYELTGIGVDPAVGSSNVPTNVWCSDFTRAGLVVKSMGDRYDLVDCEYAEGADAQQRHWIGIDVLDEAGVRVVGQPITFYWQDGEAVFFTEAKVNEPYSQSIPMHVAGNVYGIRFQGVDIWGFGLGTIDQPQAKLHRFFGLVFKRRMPRPVPYGLPR